MSLSTVAALLSSAECLERLCDVSLKGVVLLAATAIFSLVFGRASSATKHALWMSALIGLGLLPLIAALLPAWRLPLPSPWPATAASISSPPPAAERKTIAAAGVLDAAVVATTASLPQIENVPSPASPGRPSPGRPWPALADAPATAWRSWLANIWLFGALATLTPMAFGLASLHRVRVRCRPAASRLIDALRRLQVELHIGRSVALLQSENRVIPMTWGLFRPVIVLPIEAQKWPAERLQAVLLHELAHIARNDWLMQMLAQSIRALHWVNPLAWFAVSRIRTLQEHACDDLVLGAGMNRDDYAEQLLAVTSGCRAMRSLAVSSLAMGRASRMERRLKAILDPHSNRRSLSRRSAFGVALLAMAAVAPLAVVNLNTTAAAPDAKPSTIAPPVALPAEPANAQADAAQEATLEAESARLGELRAKILAHYYKKTVDGRKLTAGAIQGMLSALSDPYAQYLSPDEMRQMSSQIHGKLVGIGAQLGMRSSPQPGGQPEAIGQAVVITPLEDSPALKAGLQPGDELLAIDGKPTDGLKLAEIVRSISGDEGTVVKIKVRRPDRQVVELPITRGAIKLRTVAGLRRNAAGQSDYWLDSKTKIGYARISQFAESTPAELEKMLNELVQQDLQGLVLDVRFCAGGLLAASVDACKLFLSQGEIVSVKALEEPAQRFEADGVARFPDLPLVMLIGDQTASAAEIFAGSLQDRRRAIAVGSRTFGKGSVQSIVKFGDEGAGLRLTTAYFYLPSGRSLDRHAGGADWGVEPNEGFYVPLDREQAVRLVELQQQRDLFGKPAIANPPDLERLTPQTIEKEFADPQLAAALKTMLARFATGDYLRSGQSKDEAARSQRLMLVQQKRAELQRQIEQLQRELDELNRTDEFAGPPAKP